MFAHCEVFDWKILNAVISMWGRVNDSSLKVFAHIVEYENCKYKIIVSVLCMFELAIHSVKFYDKVVNTHKLIFGCHVSTCPNKTKKSIL